jgi:hypothetical protein
MERAQTELVKRNDDDVCGDGANRYEAKTSNNDISENA